MKHTILGLAILASFSSLASNALDLYTLSNNNTDNLMWVGHTSPDTDTVASAVMAATIYGGKATTPENLNPESQFVFEYCNSPTPQITTDYAAYQVGIVDFNQSTQLAHTIEPSSIVAIIDHHAIGGTPINIPNIASIDIRAWGSTATILASNAEALNIKLPKSVACVGLGAILSDTVIFQSSTTTDYDKAYANKLAKIAGVTDIEEFGQQMLIAKSDLSHLSADTILTMDYKNFEFGGKKVGIGVAETLTAQQLIDRKDEFVSAMKSYKATEQLDYLFFSITDTKNKRANIMWVDDGDKQILSRAFDTKIDGDILSLNGVTSRKRQIGPAIQQSIESL
ncbi:manganese-dependent inorganic pyrophosphatase [Thaumasiovibrio sp. DFM-14]|uniref:manganese-dependent inorganic pyrophosphatase n=1 Tax=Thaumasiovibrio sp. DFM-14 TaxID=3384792 RepID=UPI00399FAAAD